MTSVRASRDFVDHVLTEWQMASLIADIKLCVSELATNALLHAVPRGREFSVHLRATDEVVRLAVRDSGGGHPAVRRVSEESGSGRGLFLAQQMAAELGIDHHIVGRTVLVAFDRPAAQ
ncbi:ATP-binding protein [Streptomyces sp. NPDC057428]|uniref:ATP-binding protein n=1 Tax=Streptomyces sp. NPDC057428 TaxID=3346129 RepID=UPI00369A0164